MIYITGITGHSGRWFLKRLVQEEFSEPLRLVMRKSKEEAPEQYELLDQTLKQPISLPESSFVAKSALEQSSTMVTETKKPQDTKALQIEFAVGDLRDENFLRESLEDVHTLIHIAAIGLSKTLMEIAVETGVKRAILVHTTGRFSKYKSASADYIRIEDEIIGLRDEGKINLTILRPTMIYGSSRDHNIYRLVGFLARSPVFPVFGSGNNLMQPVHARDLGNAYYEVLTKPETTVNKDYNLSGKEPLTYLELLQTVSRHLGKKTLFIHIPLSLSLFAAKVYNGIFGKKAIITVEQVMRMNEDKAFDHSDATEDFGYAPCSFDEGIADEVAEYLSGKRVNYKNVRY